MTLPDSNTAALNAYEREQDRLPALADGEDVCCLCGSIEEEGNLWRAGGEGEPTCTRCVMSGDRHYRELRSALRVAVAVLEVASQTDTAKRIVNEARNLLDGQEHAA